MKRCTKFLLIPIVLAHAVFILQCIPEELFAKILISISPTDFWTQEPVNYENCSCTYCKDLHRLSEVHMEADMPPHRWEAEHGLNGRPAIISLSNFSHRLSHFDWAHLKWCSAFAKNSITFETTRAPGSRRVSRNIPADLKDAASLLLQLPVPQGMAQQYEWYISWVLNHGDLTDETYDLLQQRLGCAQLPFMPAEWTLSRQHWIFLAHVRRNPALDGRPWHKDSVGGTGTFHVQLYGSKRWVLRPLPHCTSECGSQVELIVRAGQAISINADKWYHTTSVGPHSREIPLSLSVAREYHTPWK